MPDCIPYWPSGYAPDVIVWEVIGYKTRTFLIWDVGNLITDMYISNSLRSVVLSYISGLPNAILKKNNTRLHVESHVLSFL